MKGNARTTGNTLPQVIKVSTLGQTQSVAPATGEGDE